MTIYVGNRNRSIHSDKSVLAFSTDDNGHEKLKQALGSDIKERRVADYPRYFEIPSHELSKLDLVSEFYSIMPESAKIAVGITQPDAVKAKSKRTTKKGR